MGTFNHEFFLLIVSALRLSICCFFATLAVEHILITFFVNFTFSPFLYLSHFFRGEKKITFTLVFYGYVKKNNSVKDVFVCIFLFRQSCFMIFFFSISDIPQNFSGGQLTSNNGCSRSIYCTVCQLICFFCFCLFLVHVLLLESDTAVQKHFYPSG